MSGYFPGTAFVGGLSMPTLDVIELRVISNLIQQQSGSAAYQDELRILRNDQAQELGIVPPVVPGN